MTSVRENDLAIVLTGGGARAAYQVGVLRGIARRFPQTKFDIITGVSAGAINAIFLASRDASLAESVEELSHLLGWGLTLVSGGLAIKPRKRGLVDTAPLRRLLPRLLPQNGFGEIAGFAGNVARCEPKAVAVTTLNYTPGQTVTWVSGCEIETWERPLRRSVKTRFTVDHVMASAALPILFSAVRLGGAWYGDGGIRLPRRRNRRPKATLRPRRFSGS